MPTTERLIALAIWAGVALDWLATGRGEKLPQGLFLDERSNRVLVAMQTLPEYLKEAAVTQVETLRDASKHERKRP